MATDFYTRALDISDLLHHKSILLLGPRQTGKSTLLTRLFPNALYINLLEADTFREFSARPETLRQRLTGTESQIILDEIQKLPELLDEVQLLLDRNKSLRFILTGSSARKLKAGKANLLGGRALTTFLHPLTWNELGHTKFDRQLLYGGLPGIYTSEIPHEELRAYVGTYLKEEIQAEGLTRNLPQFSRFLEIVAGSNGEQINYTAIGSDCGINPRTVRDHFQILYDTLVAFHLPCYGKTKKRKAVSTEKFYFFDIGVAHSLQRRTGLSVNTPEYGRALEHLLFIELKAFIDYCRLDLPLEYWRSQSHFEVDFIWGDSIAIEVKAKETVSDRDLKGLRALKEEKLQKRYICVCLERHPRKTDSGIEIMPVNHFLKMVWSREFF